MGPDGITEELYQTFKNLTIFLKLLPQKWKWGNISKLILWSQQYPGKDTARKKKKKTPGKDTSRKGNYHPVPLMNVDAKIFNKILVKWIQQHVERIIHHDQVGFTPALQGWFNLWKLIKVMNHSNRMKENNHMIVSTNA